MLKVFLTTILITLTIVLSGQVTYFPTTDATWSKIEPSALNWNAQKLAELKEMLGQKGTKAFIILVDGKIVVDWYMNGHTSDKPWYWASAGKTLTSTLVGIAESQGKLKLTDPTSKYLGLGWTSCSSTDENKITIWNQLTMTSGLDEKPNPDCTDAVCLKCIEEPGKRWSYHNGPYTLLDKVIETATGTTLNQYFAQSIGSKINMTGSFITSGYNKVFWSTPYSAARFGLLLLNEGKWSNTQIIPIDYVRKMKTSSQTLNPSYGYLTWLNGKGKYMVPLVQFVFNGNLIPSAPQDLFAGLGKNDQKIHVIPSQKMVVIRLGDDAGSDNPFVPTQLDEEIWKLLGPAIGYSPTSTKISNSNQIKYTIENGVLSFEESSEVKAIIQYDVKGRKSRATENNKVDLHSGLNIIWVRTSNGKAEVLKIFN